MGQDGVGIDLEHTESMGQDGAGVNREHSKRIVQDGVGIDRTRLGIECRRTGAEGLYSEGLEQNDWSK
ncbi:hypothetical protein XELAEV_18009625mg [Xenopus laevis]|uniref:Uncharacterized protein n=1 Tax=Xenopus laevis TaxID=8355 RepID=A0A974DUU8_XENLA|nr:hypothetical protein XELAEV_18009625mg [Xenopus laevis]